MRKKDWHELVESSEKMTSVFAYNSWNHFRLLLLRTILFIRIGSEENLPIQEYTAEKVTVNVHFQKLMRQKNSNSGEIFIQKKMSWIFMISQLDDNMMDSTVHPPPRHIIQHDQEGKNFLSAAAKNQMILILFRPERKCSLTLRSAPVEASQQNVLCAGGWVWQTPGTRRVDPQQ